MRRPAFTDREEPYVGQQQQELGALLLRLNAMDKERKELFGRMMVQRKSSLDLCLFPGQVCARRAIRAHSVQNSTVLEMLSRDGHVVMLMSKLSITQDEPVSYSFELVGRNRATTFTGLCSEHDAELFRPIDTEEIDTNNSLQLFLLSYRSLLREAHASLKAALDTQLAFQQGVEKELFPKDESFADDWMIAACLVEIVKQEYENAALKKEYHRIEHCVFHLDVEPCLAVSSMFSTEIQAENREGPAFVTLNIFPQGATTTVVFSFEQSQKGPAIQAFNHIWEATGHYRLYELTKLVLRKCENFVLSPTVYDAFSEGQRDAITKFFERNTCGHSFDMNAPELFLFGGK